MPAGGNSEVGGSELDGKGMGLWRGEGDGDAGAAIGGGLAVDTAPLDGGHKAGFLDAEGNGEGGGGGRLVEQQDGKAVLAVFALREAYIASAIGAERTGGIDGPPVGIEPGAYLLHPLEGLGREVALRVGAYVEEKVATFGHNVG